MTKIGIIGAGTGALLPPEFLRWLRKRMLKLWNLTRITFLLTFLNSKTECTLFSHDLNFPTLNGASLYGLEREVRKVVGARSKSARTGREARLEKLIDGRNNVLYQSRDSE
jgi:hypothetical protein